ncbi:iron chaperone [Spirosoma gilvum]
MDKSIKTQPTTVDEYIAAQPESTQATLQQIRQIIRQAAPDAEELISYQMPGYRSDGKLIWFAAAKNHYGLYIVPAILNQFKDRLSAYTMTKSAVHIPLDAPISADLLTEIVQYGVQKNQEQKLIKEQAKKR